MFATMNPLQLQPAFAASIGFPVKFSVQLRRRVSAMTCLLGITAGQPRVSAQPSPVTAPSTASYQAFSDTAEIPDESAAREALESTRYQLASDPELAVSPTPSAEPATGGATLSPALAEQMRSSRDRSIAQIQKMIDETDRAENPEQHKQLEDALARTKASYAELLDGTAAPAPSSPAPVAGATTPAADTGGLKIPAIGDRQPTLAEALANLQKMLRDNSPASAIAAFKKSEDYNDAKMASANAAAAVMLKRPMAALAGLLRAHELEPKKPGHLINLAGLTASFQMPRHTLALLEAAEKLLPSAGPTDNDAGGLKARAVLLTNRGRALVHVKRFEQAEAALREAVRLEPTLSEAKINLAHALYFQSDTKKKAEAIETMRFARYRLATPPATTPAPAPTPAPTAPPPAPGGTEPPAESAEEPESEQIAERQKRRPAHDLFDLSIGKKCQLPTIKIPRKIADGHAMWKKIHDLQQETIESMSTKGARMNELWDIMTNREHAGEMARISGQRAQDIFWYISNAHTEPELQSAFREYTQAMQDPGNGTYGGQLHNPFASHELEKEMDIIMASDAPWEIKVQQLYDAIEPYHGTWQGPIHDLETDTHRLAEKYYRHSTAIAAHLSDPVHHEYANLLIETRTLSYFSGYLTALETVARFDYNNIEAWTAIRGPGEAEDPTDGDYPESDWCPNALKGEYKVKATVKIFEVSVNCEKVGFQIAAGDWVKAFAEVESTWVGDKSIFIGSAVEAALPGGGPSAEAKSGFFVNVNAAGEITDFGLKSTHSTGVNVGPVGYEREVENTFSLMSVLSSPPTWR